MTKIKPLPCPRCGMMPVIDTGLSDAPYPPGHEYVYCPAVLVGVPGIPDQSCGTHSEGVAAWNRRAPVSAPVAGPMSDAVSRDAVKAAIDGYWESIGGGMPEGPSGEAILETLAALSTAIAALPAVPDATVHQACTWPTCLCTAKGQFCQGAVKVTLQPAPDALDPATIEAIARHFDVIGGDAPLTGHECAKGVRGLLPSAKPAPDVVKPGQYTCERCDRVVWGGDHICPGPASDATAVMCGGCGNDNPQKRCIGCLHDFGTPDSAWVRRYQKAVAASDAVEALDVAAKAFWRAAEAEAARQWNEHEATVAPFSELSQETRDSLTRTAALAALRALGGDA